MPSQRPSASRSRKSLFNMKTPYWLFPWNFKKKITNHFLWHSLEKGFPALCALFRQRLGLSGITGKEGKILQPPSQHISLKKALLEYVVVSSPQCGKKIELFFQFFPWRDPRPRHFSSDPCGTSRKKASTIFYNTALKRLSPPSAPFSGNGSGWAALRERKGKSFRSLPNIFH